MDNSWCTIEVISGTRAEASVAASTLEKSIHFEAGRIDPRTIIEIELQPKDTSSQDFGSVLRIAEAAPFALAIARALDTLLRVRKNAKIVVKTKHAQVTLENVASSDVDHLMQTLSTLLNNRRDT